MCVESEAATNAPEIAQALAAVLKTFRDEVAAAVVLESPSEEQIQAHVAKTLAIHFAMICGEPRACELRWRDSLEREVCEECRVQ